MVGMNTESSLQDHASDLAEAARSFQAATQAPESYTAAPDSLAALEDTLQALSAAWYQLAAHATPGIAARRRDRESDVLSWQPVDGLSREQEARLIGTLHDIAAAFARCARECRHGRSAVTPLIARRIAAEEAAEAAKQPDDAGLAWFDSRQRPTQRVA